MLTKAHIFSLIMVASVGVLAGRSFSAEEAIRTPSDQMKDAVNKLGKAPSTIGKSLQDLTGAAKEKLRETFGTATKPESKAGPVDLNVPKKSPAAPAAPVELKGSDRDPFHPMTLSPKVNVTRRPRENLSPLEQKDLSQLNLHGIIEGAKEPVAVIVDTAGVSYFVTVGTPIGLNEGIVKAIHANQIIVEEFCENAYGVEKKCQRTKSLSSEK